MESEFLSLCDYNIYVSAESYILYQAQVRAISFPEVTHQHCNRTSAPQNQEPVASIGPATSLLQRLMRATSFGSVNEYHAQQQAQQSQNDFTIDTATVPLLSHEQKNPILRFEASITSHQNSDFTIKQAIIEPTSFTEAHRKNSGDTKRSKRQVAEQNNQYKLQDFQTSFEQYDNSNGSQTEPVVGSAEIVFNQAEFGSLPS